jgi:acyl transferase domain-containing protein/acyl carrier protein
MSNDETDSLTDSIAIIGMACRFPGADTVEQFWHNLKHGVESINFFSDDELDRAVIDPAELTDPRYVKARATLANVEAFDAGLFGFTPREAELTDPQHRLFLECAWEALEHAGYDANRYPGQIGVFGGAGANTYLLFHLAASGQLGGSSATLQAFIHNKNDHLSTRTAYKLNLRGPAVTVQTACSTSLVAVTMATQSLLNYQVDMALAGASSIMVPQRTGYLYHERGIGSPDGHCRVFDADAKGTVGGNGAGVVLLKRYEDALRDGDSIHAVLRGCALNNDGALRVGYTAPNADSQAEVIALAQALAGVAPDSISYVEAHGTGTPIGDPIELQALTQAFRRGTDKTGYCAIGSVKSNIGHLDTTAGVAGLIKTVLALGHKQIPPSLHFKKPNPRIDFAQSPFYVNSALREWRVPGGGPRRAGVSSFGLGGTNAHVIVEEAPPLPPSAAARPWQLILVSGHTVTALETACRNLTEHLKKQQALKLADVAFTLQVGRKPQRHRRMLVCRDLADAVATLEALVPERVFTREQEPARRPLTFMFPGQGAQHVNMGAELYRGEPRFAAEIDRCCEILTPPLGLDLRTILYPEPERVAEAARLLDQTQYTQPALFVVEYALAQLWLSWGVEPDYMIGHSVGEYVAACLAGVFSLEDALALVATRGRMVQALPAGAMLAVPMAAEALRPLLGGALSLAAINGLQQCVVSGPTEAVAALEAQLTAQKQICRRLNTSHAFHSAMLDPIVDAFRQRVASVTLCPPTRRYLSNVSGTFITAAEATDPAYWAAHLRQTVRFADGLGELLAAPDALFLEVGPGKVLRTLVRWHPHKKPDQFMLSTLPHPQDKQSDYQHLWQTIGHLWLAGLEPSWTAIYANERRQRLPLPTYPFERQRYWIDLPERAAGRPATTASLHKRPDITDWFYVPTWRAAAADAALPIEGAAATWLVFEDDAGVTAAVVAELERAGQRVRRVRAGSTFAVAADGVVTIDALRREDYDQLLRLLDEAGDRPARVLHSWSVTRSVAPALDAALASGLESLLLLAQALGARPAAELQLTVLANRVVAVAGDDVLEPTKATLIGACQVIPREYPSLRCRLVDVELPADERRTRMVSERLARELVAAPEHAVVAYRAGRRWVRDFEALRLPEVAAPATLRTGGVYLITGGLGGLGLAVAGHLAHAVKARLVLIGRSAPTEAARQKLQAIEAAGAEVLVLQADVTDEAQLAAAIARARARFGAINGVIHAAGVAAGGLIQRRAHEALAATLAPKVRGAELLDRLLAADALDCFLVFSSLSTIVGRLGQVDYTAANAFLDAFAHERYRRTGSFTCAINWGAWEEVGMAAAHAAPATRNGNGARDGNGAGDGERIGHPLLDRRLTISPTQDVFVTDFNVSRHWVLDEHRILGNPVIPGVAYFEMARAALGERAAGKIVELQDVVFLQPLRVRDGETRPVRMVLEAGEDGYRFVVRSAVGDDNKLQEYAAGYIALADAEPLRRHDLAAIRARCNARELLLAAEEREEDLGPRWHSVQRVNLGHNEVLLYLELPEAFLGDFEHMKFHPALLDRAAGIAKNFLAKDGHYLPLTYKKVQIKAPLQRQVYSYARFREEDDPTRETITFDIVLMDTAGNGLVEIEGFSQKRVNDPGAEIRALAALADGPVAAAEIAGDDEARSDGEIRPGEGAAAFGRILVARVSPQVIVSVRDLHASIAESDRVVRQRILDAAAAVPESVGRTLHPRPDLSTPYVAPRTEVEQIVAATWQQVLGLERVGINDNFFDLGGDSLVAIQVIARLERRFKVDIPPVSIFEGATISRLVEAFMSGDEKEAPTFDERQSRGAERRNRAPTRRARSDRDKDSAPSEGED